MEGNSRRVANREVYNFSFAIIQNQKIGWHPCFDIFDTVLSFLNYSLLSADIETDVKLGVISIFYAGVSVPCYNALQGSGIQDKTYGTTHRPLGHTKVN